MNRDYRGRPDRKGDRIFNSLEMVQLGLVGGLCVIFVSLNRDISILLLNPTLVALFGYLVRVAFILMLAGSWAGWQFKSSWQFEVMELLARIDPRGRDSRIPFSTRPFVTNLIQSGGFAAAIFTLIFVSSDSALERARSIAWLSPVSSALAAAPTAREQRGPDKPRVESVPQQFERGFLGKTRLVPGEPVIVGDVPVSFRMVFFSAVLLTILSLAGSILMALLGPANLHTNVILDMCSTTWKMGFGAILGLIGGRSLG